MADETLGSLSVQITGDYSDLQQSIDSAAASAQSGASKIEQAFQSSDVAAGMVASMENLSGAVNQAAQQFSTFGQEASSAVTDVNDQLSSFETGGIDSAVTALQSLSSNASEAVAPAQQIGESVAEAGESAEKAGGSFEGFGEQLLKISELAGAGFGVIEAVESLKDLATESINAYGKLQMVETGLTALTGSADKATQILEQMKEISASTVFSFPQLAQGAQTLASLGVAAASIPQEIDAIASAAELTGKSFDGLLTSVDRVFLSGELSSRSLSQLGISMQDLAQTMGVSVNEVRDKFKELGPSSQQALDILVTTVKSKFSDAAAAMQNTLPVAINSVKTEWDSLLEDFGRQVSPALTEAIGAIKEALPTIEQFAATLATAAAVSFDQTAAAWGSLRDLGKDLGGEITALKDAAVAAVPELGAIGSALSKANDAFSAASITNYITHLQDLATVARAADEAFQILTNRFSTMDKAVANGADNFAKSVAGIALAADTAGKATDSFGTAAQKVSDELDKAHTALANAQKALEAIDSSYKDASNYAELHAAAVNNVNKAQTSLNSILGESKPKAESYAQAMKQMGESMATVPTQAEAIQSAIDKINAKIVVQQSTLQNAIDVWAKLASDSSASATSIADAYKAVENAAKALGLTDDDLTGKIDAAKAAEQGLDDILINGKTVWTQSKTLADALALSNKEVGDSSLSASDKITTLYGSLSKLGDGYKAAKQDGDSLVIGLNSVETVSGGVVTSINAIGTAAGQAADAFAAAEEKFAETSAHIEDTFNSLTNDIANSVQGMLGGGGGGRSGSSAEQVLSQYVAAGASGGELDQIAHALGLIVVGQNQYETLSAYNENLKNTATAGNPNAPYMQFTEKTGGGLVGTWVNLNNAMATSHTQTQSTAAATQTLSTAQVTQAAAIAQVTQAGSFLDTQLASLGVTLKENSDGSVTWGGNLANVAQAQTDLNDAIANSTGLITGNSGLTASTTNLGQSFATTSTASTGASANVGTLNQSLAGSNGLTSAANATATASDTAATSLANLAQQLTSLPIGTPFGQSLSPFFDVDQSGNQTFSSAALRLLVAAAVRNVKVTFDSTGMPQFSGGSPGDIQTLQNWEVFGVPGVAVGGTVQGPNLAAYAPPSGTPIFGANGSLLSGSLSSTGGGLNVTVNLSGANIYGTSGTQAFANDLANQLRTVANSQRLV